MREKQSEKGFITFACWGALRTEFPSVQAVLAVCPRHQSHYPQRQPRRPRQGLLLAAFAQLVSRPSSCCCYCCLTCVVWLVCFRFLPSRSVVLPKQQGDACAPRQFRLPALKVGEERRLGGRGEPQLAASGTRTRSFGSCLGERGRRMWRPMWSWGRSWIPARRFRECPVGASMADLVGPGL